jgi:hypothetical protein
MQVLVHGGMASAVETTIPAVNAITKTKTKTTANSFFIEFHLLLVL